MKIEFTREQRITNALVLHATSVEDCGLLHGKMGIVLYFHYLARSSGNAIFTEFATELIDNVTESLHSEIPIDFERGITGIGWAVGHLVQNGFVDADADDILEEFDEKVIQTIENGVDDLDILLSLGYYLVSRLKHKEPQKYSANDLELTYSLTMVIDALLPKIIGVEQSSEIEYLIENIYQIEEFDYKQHLLKRTTNCLPYSYIVPFVKSMSSRQIEDVLGGEDVKSKYAGFDMSQIVENERWGLKSGIAGFGLQKLLLK